MNKFKFFVSLMTKLEIQILSIQFNNKAKG